MKFKCIKNTTGIRWFNNDYSDHFTVGKVYVALPYNHTIRVFTNKKEWLRLDIDFFDLFEPTE